jgi:hypothetical protein
MLVLCICKLPLLNPRLENLMQNVEFNTVKQNPVA